MLEDLFKVVRERLGDDKSDKTEKQDVEIPKDLLFKCPRCSNVMYMEDFEKNRRVCTGCGYHARLSWQERIRLTADKDTFREFDGNMQSLNPIGFPGYQEKLSELKKEYGINEAIVTGECLIHGYRAVIGVMDSHFMMASMGSVVGEKIARAFEYAADNSLPVILFTASGGARMQEGIVSLMQMAKTSGAVAMHDKAGQLYITVLTDPTTGGVTASFASLGDIIIAEPKILVGFAGRRVIQGTIRQQLPDDFQSAEFLHEHGFVDMIVDRMSMRTTLARLLRLHNYKKVENIGSGASK